MYIVCLPMLQPEKVENIMGSTAGAGSGEFHTYRMHRRTEILRVEDMERRAKEEVRHSAYNLCAA